MASSELVSGGRPSAPARRELQGPRPSPLKLQNSSQKIKKHQPAQPPRGRIRPPVVIYMVSPKIIHVQPDEFMSMVQRLTGADSASAALTTYGRMANASSASRNVLNDGIITSIGPTGNFADGMLPPVLISSRERLISRDLPQINFELSSAMPLENNQQPYNNVNHHVLANAPLFVPSPGAICELLD